MSNVLPQQYKKIEASRVRTRFLLMGSLMLAAGALVAMLALLPSFISVRIAREGVEVSETARAAAEDQSAALRAQALLETLRPLATATSSPRDALALALAERPAGVSVDVITYAADRSTIVLSGVSVRREAVSEYRDALEGTGRFSGVAVPVASLVGTQEGKFTITLTGAY